MNIEEALLTDRSKEMIKRIANYIDTDEKKFAKLMECFFSESQRLTQYASWAVNYCAENHPPLILPYLDQLLKNLDKPLHNSIKRNTIRLLTFIDIPEQHLGHVADLCFNYLNDPKEAIAVRVFSMTVLYHICLKEPDLSNELEVIIKDFLPHGSAGFKARGKKILLALQQLKEE